MNQTISKFRIFLSIEKEESWLEEMSRQGWHLIKTPGVTYTFEKGEPEERVYKIDFRFFNKQDELDEYTSMFEDSGWQPIDPRKSRNNFYFYTQKTHANKDIFSDEASKAQRNFRYASYTFYTFLIVSIPYLVLYLNGTISPTNLGYLTPGLWNMQGFDFIRHFLFETPFVIGRIIGGYLPLVILLAASLFLMRSYFQYIKKSRHG